MWSSDQIREKLLTNQTWLERAILAIYQYQTETEQRHDTTLLHNDVGFNAVDASSGSYMAKWLKSGKHLSGKFLEKARRMMPKYAGQLATIANSKAI
jgi:hypothetical protein